MTSAFVSAFVLAFSTFLPVINPFSGAMFFCTLTTSLSDRDRAFVANRIALYCLIILLVCLTCGHLILSFFGISVGVLRMAGGCVLFAAGWTALNAPTQEETTEERPALSRAKLKSMAFYAAAHDGTRCDCRVRGREHQSAARPRAHRRHVCGDGCNGGGHLGLLSLQRPSEQGGRRGGRRRAGANLRLHPDLSGRRHFLAGFLRTLVGAQRAGDSRRSCGQVSILADDGRALLLDI